MSISVKKGSAHTLGSCQSCGFEFTVYEILLLNKYSRGVSFRLCSKCITELNIVAGREGYRKSKRNSLLTPAASDPALPVCPECREPAGQHKLSCPFSNTPGA